MKIGLYGGTFNPPHLSHVNIAKKALSQLKLDKLIVMPCGVPPHKSCSVSAQTRYELSRIAFGDFAEVSDYELTKQGLSYTVDTLQMLKCKYPNDELYLVIGGDSLRDFSTWYKPEVIAKLATVVVAERKGVQSDGEAFVVGAGGKVVHLDVEPTAVSSAEVRLRFDFDFDADKFVQPQVYDYVVSHNLYREHIVLTQKLKNYLTPKRFSHTFYVTKRGLELAQGNDSERVFVACALHDCAKYVDKSRYESYGFVDEGYPEPIIHAFLGRNVAKKDFAVTDGEVLDAIYYHTTARPSMTWLDKIVYVADKTEETRNYPVEHLLNKQSFDDVFIATLVEANDYGRHSHPDFYYLTNDAITYYTKTNNGEKL